MDREKMRKAQYDLVDDTLDIKQLESIYPFLQNDLEDDAVYQTTHDYEQ